MDKNYGKKEKICEKLKIEEIKEITQVTVPHLRLIHGKIIVLIFPPKQ